VAKLEPDENLLWVNPKTGTIEPRRKNHGKVITESLPTIEVDGIAMDLYSNVEPMPRGPGVNDSLMDLLINIEYPKMAKRNKLGLYMWGDDKNYGFFRQVLESTAGQPPFDENESTYEKGDLSALKEEIKEYAENLGLLCGITKVDRRFISNAADTEFPFDTAVVLGKPIDRDLISEIPNPRAKLWDFEVYIKLGKMVFDIADFVKSKGYRAFARAPLFSPVKFPPHAVMSGLGELGAGGWVVTRQYGPWVRWCMLSVDADLIPDAPVDLGMGKYCEDCLRCVKACPAKAITKQKIWYRGVLKRKVDNKKCYPKFDRYDGCGICLKVCPIGRFGYDTCMAAYKKEGSIPKSSA